MENYGVRTATEKEINNYNKVESTLTFEEMEIIFDEMADGQVFDELLKNKVNNKQIKAIIKTHHITAKELSDWYFTECED